MCPTIENPDLVLQETGDSQSQTHARLAKCNSRLTIQARPDHPDRMIRPYRGCPVDLLPVAPATSGPVCHLVQQQIAPFSITGTRPSSMSSGCTRPALGGSGSLCLPTGSHLGQSGGEVSGIPGQENYSNCSRVAQDALVLGPSGHVKPEPFMPAQPVDSTIQSDPSQESSLRHHSGRTHLHMFPHD